MPVVCRRARLGVEVEQRRTVIARRQCRVCPGERAEAPGEGELAVGVEVLVAEEHDPVGEEGGPDLRTRLVRQFGGQVHPAHLGPDAGRQGLNLDPCGKDALVCGHRASRG